MLKSLINVTIIIKFIFLLFFATQFLAGQTLNFQHVTLADGLSQNTVYSILQDSKGFLWFGTQDGLNKYDGYNFTVINQDLVGQNKLTDRQIQCLYEDKKGLIWIGTRDGGLNLYNPILNRFSHFKYEENVQQTIQSNRITTIIEDVHSPDNIMWIGTLGGGFSKLWYKNENQYYFEHFQNILNDDNSLSNNHVTSLLQDKNGILWIGTSGGGLNKYNPKTNSFKTYTNLNNISCIKNISCLYAYSDSTIWIGTNGDGLIRFNPENEKSIVYKKESGNLNSLSDNKILSINSLNDNKKIFLLIGTDGGGLNLFDVENNLFTHYKHDSNNENSISHNNINTILTEKSGTVWFGTGASIDIYDRNAYNFRKYKHIPGNSNSLSNEYVWAIDESRDGMLWIATDNGLNQFDRKRVKYRHWFHDPNNPNSLSYNELMAIHEDKNGILWIGTWYGGLNKFDRKKNSFKHYLTDPKDPKTISDNRVRLIYEDPKDNGNILWIGTHEGGLNKFDLRTESFTSFQFDPYDENSIGNNSILSIYRDKKNNLWIGTWGGGLNKFDEKNKTFKKYKNDPDNPNSISHDIASIIYEDKRGNFWVGTHGGGLNKFDRQSESFSNINISDGLPNEVIYGILEDDDGYLWISTNKGLSRFDPTLKGKEAFKNFDKSDGLQSNEFNNGSFLKSKNGELFFGGVNGFNSFFPKSINENKYLPPVVFTDFKIFNKSVDVNPDSILKKSISYTHHIEMSYDQSVFSIEFSALNYTHPEKNQFKYKLVGFDKDWTYTKADRRIATYTNLESGEYEFLVSASNNDGFWNEDAASLMITILPPFWLTWWFRFAIFATVAGLILTVHTRRLNKVEKQNIMLEKEVSKRTQELENQKNELQNALSQVKQLGGLLPICASCKKIRDDKGYWNQIESYISKHSEADFSHGICPDCYKELYPELMNNKIKRK
jgi:ligand-binding sensor domain-containing protein